MKIAVIGNGAISAYVQSALAAKGHAVNALLLRPKHLEQMPRRATVALVTTVADLPTDTTHLIDCAGHLGLAAHGPAALRAGIDVITVSVGALAEPALQVELDTAARAGNSQLHLASGAIGALDALRAAACGGLDRVRYIGRKPPQGWIGSPAEQLLDLHQPMHSAQVHFSGSAREAALKYPKNANVAAAVALAGVGFETTEVQLIADPDISTNIHELQASGDFGSFTFTISGNSLPDNPRSSALAAMSVVASILNTQARIRS